MTAQPPLDRILSALEGVKKVSGGFVARCPAHDDRTPSLSVRAGDDGRVLLRCHAGCATEQIVAAIGLSMRDLFPSRDESTRTGTDSAHRHAEPRPKSNQEPCEEKPPKRAVGSRRWAIRDGAGHVVAVHVRTDFDDGSKKLRWERPDGQPGLGGLGSKDLPLYGIHERQPGQPTVVVEGEPARDALAPLASALGLCVVATVTGASAVPGDESLHPILDSPVSLWPDSDAAGEAHMDRLHWRLRELGQRNDAISRLAWNGAAWEAGDDAADFVKSGATAEALAGLLADAHPWSGRDEAPDAGEPKAPPAAPRLVIRSLADVTPQPIEWLWSRMLARGKLHILAGHPGEGKSSLAAEVTAIGSVGRAWPDGTPAPVFRSLFVLGEDSLDDTLRPRLDQFGADVANIKAVEAVLDEQGRERFFDVAKHLDLLEEQVVAHDIDLLVIDPISTAMAGSDRNAEGDTRDRLTPLVKLAERRNLAVLGIGHVGKPNGTTRTPLQRILGSTGLGALARIVWMTAAAEERMAVGPVKSNLAMLPDALLWTREEDGPIRWHGSAGEKLADLLDVAAPRTPRADAEGFLREFLAGGSQPSAVVEDAAKARDITKATLRRASAAIPVKKWKAPGPNGQWHWRLPDGQPQASSTPAESNLLTPIDMEVSKLSKFPSGKVLNGHGGEHLHATTPNVANGHANGHARVMEGAQLAHLETLRGEQVPTDRDGIIAQAKELATLTPDELTAYRLELASAPANDPHLSTDREALALFDAMHAAGAIA